MYYTIRMIITIYLSYDLPAEITSEGEAIAYVSDITKDSKCMTWFLGKEQQSDAHGTKYFANGEGGLI